MQYRFENGNAIPECEFDAHIAYEWCDCKPKPVKTFSGMFCWKHNCKDFAELIEDAEAVRMITSIELLKEDQDDKLKRTFIPFPVGCHEIQWPMAASGKAQDFTDFTDLEDEEDYD